MAADVDDRVVALVEQAGRVAALAGEPITLCPYDPGHGSTRERVLARVFVGAYLAVRPPLPGVVDERDELGRSVVDDDLVDELARHLPGRHNQRSHGNRYPARDGRPNIDPESSRVRKARGVDGSPAAAGVGESSPTKEGEPPAPASPAPSLGDPGTPYDRKARRERREREAQAAAAAAEAVKESANTAAAPTEESAGGDVARETAEVAAESYDAWLDRLTENRRRREALKSQEGYGGRIEETTIDGGATLFNRGPERRPAPAPAKPAQPGLFADESKEIEGQAGLLDVFGGLAAGAAAKVVDAIAKPVAPLDRLDPADQARVRNAIADHGPGIFQSPLVGGSKQDVGRYLAEGHLKELTAKHGLSNVWQAVVQAVDEAPGQLERPHAQVQADTEARTATVDALVDQAEATVKAGDFATTLQFLEQALAIDPDHRTPGVGGNRALGHRLADLADTIRKKVK